MTGLARLDFVELLQAFEEGLVVPYRLGDDGSGLLEIDGRRRSVTIRWPLAPSAKFKGLKGFKNLTFLIVGEVGSKDRHVELTLDATNHPEATLAFASAVVSQLMGDSDFELSIKSSIEAIRAFLQELDVLSIERALGLMGELLFLRSVIAEHGLKMGLEGWMGPPKGEHDFSLPGAEFEIKTTRSERRVHRISSVSQMEPSLKRKLYLVSIQLTEAGPGAGAFTLPSLINSVRDEIGENSNNFEQYLYEAGWRDWFEEVFTQGYQFRNEPQAYLVDGSFPAITKDLILDVVSNGDLVESVVYKVDVGGLTPTHGISEVEGVAKVSTWRP